MTQQSIMHQWALYYASLGWHVFPLVPGTKSPFKDSSGSSEATTDVATINAWWSANPEANIGTRPSAGGLYVFDVDPRNGGGQSFAALQQQHGEIDSFLRVDSPGGGFHLYFDAPKLDNVRYSSQPAVGIDGKYNGYAVLPPSRHPNGGTYTWSDGVLPSQERATAIPQWLVNVRTERPRVAGAAEYVGKLDDVQLIMQALEGRAPDCSYIDWVQTMASLKHWEDHTEGAEGVGYELCREWSMGDPRHDDGEFDDHWFTWDSFKPGARTLGSLLHEAGMTAAQRTPLDAAAIFNSFPPAVANPPRAIEWTTEPVPLFKGSSDPAELLAELMNSDTREFCNRWSAGDVATIIDDVCWKAGSNCEAVLGVLMQHPGIPDTPELRAWISHNCATRTTWATVGNLSAEQVAAGCYRVEVDDGKLVAAERAIVKALPEFPKLFQRNSRLVTVLDDGRILPHTLNTLCSEIEERMRVEKGGKGAPAKMPQELARRIVEREWFPGVGEVKAAVPLPVVRADGSVASAQGLDTVTGLYVINGARRAPRKLTTAEMSEAIGRVWAPFAEFPFADQSAKAVCLSAMFTAVCRPALPTAPAFIVNAQTYGTGKTLLSNAILHLTGGDVSVSAISSDGQEQAKQLTAILDEGPLAVMFDNVKGYLKDSSDFCMALTSPVYKGRLLGQSKMLKLPNRALWVLNGNNVGVSGDAVRRILPINLRSAENPELAVHGFDPVAVIRENLDALRADLVDLLVTYAAYGLTDTRAKIGGYASFEGWNTLVRGAVVWYGWGDPIAEMQAQQDADPEVEKLGLILEAWEQRFGNECVTLHTVLTSNYDPVAHDMWAEAMDAICIDKSGRLNHNLLGYFLRRMKGRKLQGKEFFARKDRRNRMEWGVM